MRKRRYLILKPLAAPAGLKADESWLNTFKFQTHHALSFFDEHGDLCIQCEGDKPHLATLMRHWICELLVNPDLKVANILAEGRAQVEDLTPTFVCMPINIDGSVALWAPSYIGTSYDGLRIVMRRDMCVAPLTLYARTGS